MHSDHLTMRFGHTPVTSAKASRRYDYRKWLAERRWEDDGGRIAENDTARAQTTPDKNIAKRSNRARLYINDESVGDVVIQGSEDSWSHGNFHPYEAFERFAPLFHQWSSLMHEHSPGQRLDEVAGAELRRLESAIDRLRAKLQVAESDAWISCSQVNIDGPLIEWKASAPIPSSFLRPRRRLRKRSG